MTAPLNDKINNNKESEMPVKVSPETEERIKKSAEWLKMSYVDTCKALLEIGLESIEKKKQLSERQQTVKKSA